ncbi:MAG: Bug family tripartite tricarboxylate transporter substrate binding protein [Betaproteobacteria bacterium]
MAYVTRILLAVLATCFCVAAQAQSFPNRPIRFVVPYGAGGASDVLSRHLGAQLAESWGQQVLVDNKPGASGLLGAEIVAKAAPDGYTIMLGVPANLCIAPALQPEALRYDPIKAFAPITSIANVPVMIAVNPNVPAQNLAEFIALAKSKPGQINFGTAGTGGFPHLAGELFKVIAGVNIQHVPYKASVAAVTDMIGGRIEAVFDYLPSTMPQVKAGRARAIAIASPSRSPAAPDVPTVMESGLGNYQAISWFGVLAPAGTPRPIIEHYHKEILRIVATPEMRSRFANAGAEVYTNASPEEFARVIQDDTARWTDVIRSAKITMK